MERDGFKMGTKIDHQGAPDAVKDGLDGEETVHVLDVHEEAECVFDHLRVREVKVKHKARDSNVFGEGSATRREQRNGGDGGGEGMKETD